MILAKSTISIFALKFAASVLAISCGLLSQTSAADAKLNPAKLKPGDKLEFEKRRDEWETVEYVGTATNPNMVLVNRPPFSRPVPTAISKLRLPKPAAVAATPPAANAGTKTPAATPPAPRMWSDRTGGFKVEAVFVRLEDGKAVLKRTDNNTEISVPLEKLSDADQKIVSSLQTAAAPTESISMKAPRTAESAANAATKDSGAAGEKSANKDELAITKTDYKTARQIKLPPAADWTYQPEAAAKSALARTTPVKLQPGNNVFDNPERVFPLAKDKKAFVVFVDHSPRSDAYVSTVQACNLETGKVDGAKVFGVGYEPMDMSADGTVVLARSSGFQSDKHGEMRVYSRTGNAVKAVSAWRPYATETVDDEVKTARGRADKEAGVEWAALVDNEHAFTLGDRELVLWHLPDAKPIYRVSIEPLTFPALSAGKKFIVVPSSHVLVILSALDGQVLGTVADEPSSLSADVAKAAKSIAALPNLARAVSMLAGTLNNSTVALSDDGLRLAVARGNRFRVWDLKTREMTRDFMIEGITAVRDSKLSWLSNKHLLLAGQYVIDVERRIPISKSVRGLEAYTIEAGKTWYIEPAFGRDPRVLKVAAMPDEAMLAAAAKINADELLVLRPGINVALDLQAGGTPEEIEETRKALTEKLLAHGMNISPESTTRLVASIGPGKTQAMQYRRFGASPFGPGEEHQVTTQLLSLSFQVNGETVWKHEQSSYPPGSLSLKKDETIDQAIAREMESRNASISIKQFAQIPLPGYLARFPKTDAAK